MSERVKAQAKTSSTPVTTQAQSQLQQRSLRAEVTPAPKEQTEQPDLQTQLENAKRSGFDFSRVKIYSADQRSFY